MRRRTQCSTFLALILVQSLSPVSSFANNLVTTRVGCMTDLDTSEVIMNSPVKAADESDFPKMHLAVVDDNGNHVESPYHYDASSTKPLDIHLAFVNPYTPQEFQDDLQFVLHVNVGDEDEEQVLEEASVVEFVEGGAIGCDGNRRMSARLLDANGLVTIRLLEPTKSATMKVLGGWATGHSAVRLVPELVLEPRRGAPPEATDKGAGSPPKGAEVDGKRKQEDVDSIDSKNAQKGSNKNKDGTPEVNKHPGPKGGGEHLSKEQERLAGHVKGRKPKEPKQEDIHSMESENERKDKKKKHNAPKGGQKTEPVEKKGSDHLGKDQIKEERKLGHVKVKKPKDANHDLKKKDSKEHDPAREGKRKARARNPEGDLDAAVNRIQEVYKEHHELAKAQQDSGDADRSPKDKRDLLGDDVPEDERKRDPVKPQPANSEESHRKHLEEEMNRNLPDRKSFRRRYHSEEFANKLDMSRFFYGCAFFIFSVGGILVSLGKRREKGRRDL